MNSLGYEILKIKDMPKVFSIGNWVKKLNIETILDVGSNEGQFIEEIRLVLPNKKIIAFEPIKAMYDKLILNTAGQNVIAHNVGLGDKESSSEINISKNYVSSSFLKMSGLHEETYPASKYTHKETIQIKRLDDMVKVGEEKRNILLKIDVQGYEDKVIAGGLNTIKAVSAVIIEISFAQLYDGQWLFADTYDFFVKNGFKFIGFADQILNNDLEIPIFGDALFVREDLAKKLYQ